MKKILTVICIFLTFSCTENSTQQSNNIKSISFSEQGPAAPSDDWDKLEITITPNETSLVQNIAKNHQLIASKTIKSTPTTEENKALLSNIPKKYLDKDRRFVAPNTVDDTYIIALITLNSGKTITWSFSWSLSDIPEGHPKKIMAMHGMYLKLREELYMDK